MTDKNYYDMACIIHYKNINHQNERKTEQTDFKNTSKKIRKLEINLLERTLIFNNVTIFPIYLLLN